MIDDLMTELIEFMFTNDLVNSDTVDLYEEQIRTIILKYWTAAC